MNSMTGIFNESWTIFTPAELPEHTFWARDIMKMIQHGEWYSGSAI